MDIDQLLINLRRQYGVSAKFARSLRPLLESAARSPAERRNRLRALVERSFAAEAKKHPQVSCIKMRAESKPSLLSSMAELLHGWTPGAWVQLPPDSKAN